MNQASERHIGSVGDGVTGAPVIELGYNHSTSCAVPDKVDMATYR
ncbi:hypothetical protein SAMN06295960_1558 [Paenibacillus aquistagni]|uniref:Uncharacterized protein n=1 Tax=Paenibacillus aquistagni TaxID=1852522 RepID=A0A1X7JG90_9BACL|nr:hypothetical protein SAMN06295960_1558 [Paenibacillus aquistagni]